MATTLPPSLTPAEVSFLAESEAITIIPRQRLESISLLGVYTHHLPNNHTNTSQCTTPALRPPLPADIPLWLALLLKRQGRANIIPPPWLSVAALTEILSHETMSPSFAPAPDLETAPGAAFHDTDGRALVVSPPFQTTSTRFADPRRLPYHFLSIAHLVLLDAEDDVPDAEAVRRLLRDVREVRAAKLRKGVDVLDGSRVAVLNGVGALELAEQAPFIRGVVDGLRVVGASKEVSRRERERDEGAGGTGLAGDETDEEML